MRRIQLYKEEIAEIKQLFIKAIPILISTLDTFNNEIPIDLFVLEVFQHQYL